MPSKKQFDRQEALATKGTLSQRGLAEATDQSVGNVNRIRKELAGSGLIDNGALPSAGLAALE